MNQFAVVPSPRGNGFVELSRSKQGRVFRKQILHYGDLIYPGLRGGKVKVDKEFADTLIANFAAGVADIVQVPKVDGNNQHTEDPDRNIGEVINVVKTDKGVYVDLDVRTDDAEKIGKTLLGASAMLHLNYTDTHTGKKVGPTLLHTAITNRPYVTNLDGFEEVIAASQTGADISTQVLVLSPANDEENLMTREEMIAALKEEHGIDVSELQAKADSTVALSAKIQEQLVGTGLLTLSNSDDDVSTDQLIGAIKGAADQIVDLSGKVDELSNKLNTQEAEATVDEKVRGGFILAKNRNAMVKLLLSNAELFDEIVPDKPVIRLSHEEGQEPVDGAHEATVDAEIARLSALVDDQTAKTRS